MSFPLKLTLDYLNIDFDVATTFLAEGIDRGEINIADDSYQTHYFFKQH